MILYVLSNTKKIDVGDVSSTCKTQEGLAHNHLSSDNSVSDSGENVKYFAYKTKAANQEPNGNPPQHNVRNVTDTAAAAQQTRDVQAPTRNVRNVSAGTAYSDNISQNNGGVNSALTG